MTSLKINDDLSSREINSAREEEILPIKAYLRQKRSTCMCTLYHALCVLQLLLNITEHLLSPYEANVQVFHGKLHISQCIPDTAQATSHTHSIG